MENAPINTADTPTAPQAPLVFKAINAVQAELAQSGISKDRSTTGGAKFKFRGIDDIYNALSPLLARHALVITPRFENRQVVERKTNNGGALFYITVTGHFDFISAIDGSKHTVTTFGEAMDSGDKGTNKAMSIAYKYACFQVFAIPTEGDNDPDATVHPPLQPQVQAQRITPQQHQLPPSNQNQSQQGFPSLPAPTNEVVRTTQDGKSYDQVGRRIFTPDQFNQVIFSIQSGEYRADKFMDSDKYWYSAEQAQVLMQLQSQGK